MNYLLFLTKSNCQKLLRFHATLMPLIERVTAREPPKEITVKFADDLFLEPQHIVLLASVFEYCSAFKIGVTLIYAHNSKVLSYLNSIRFTEYWKPGFVRTQYTQIPSGTSFCLWQINQPMVSQFRDAAGKFFEDKFLPGLNLEPLTVSMSEVFNNINEHAHSSISGYTITQYFPQKKKLIMAVCDFGIGIPTSINGMLAASSKPLKSHVDAVEYAMQKAVTSQSTPRNRGYGLHTISQYAEHFNGSLMLLSNFACVYKIGTYPLRKVSLPINFPGTLVVLSLNTDTLPPKETETEEEYSL